MTVDSRSHTRSLYEQDFNLWLSTTAGQLRERKFDEVDLENLIREIESMGRSEINSLKSFCKRLIEHLLKLAYWDSERAWNQIHWEIAIDNFRDEIQDILAESPSLRNTLPELLIVVYAREAKKIKKYKWGDSIPADCPFTLEQIIDPDWYPVYSHPK